MSRFLNRTGLMARSVLSIGRKILTLLAIVMILVGVVGWAYTRVASTSPAMANGLVVALLTLVALIIFRVLINRRNS
ncbi:hypothetical protein [Erwinia amylovora]|uniref:hypothetical protein n=1 Tax=Erwinia amylovora TaxID=552 RepID=UPI0020BF7C26|nr:hypothetical protein [Erwinia amylovora]MCK8410892.1 hypothetical protein [Erwinia amylovora]